MCYFTCVFAQNFHFGTISCIMQSYVSFCVTYNHPFLQEIKLKSRNLIGSDVHVNSFNISIESTPNFDFVPHWGEETQFFFYIFTTDCCVLICCMRVIIFVILINVNRLSSENQLQWFVYYNQ